MHGVRDWLRFQGARLGVTYDVNGHFTLDQVLDSNGRSPYQAITEAVIIRNVHVHVTLNVGRAKGQHNQIEWVSL